MRVSRRIRGTIVMGTALLLGACSGDAGEVMAPSEPLLNATATGVVRLAKLGPAGTTATFEISATGGSLPVGSTITIASCVEGEFCFPITVWRATDASLVEVTITEVDASENMALDWINTQSDLDGVVNYGISGTLDDIVDPTVIVRVDNAHDALVRYKNLGVLVPPPPPPPPPPSEGIAGCTPGFWKQTHHFQYWTTPYAPNTLFDDVFANAFPGMTLLDVLNQGGGGLKALGRHTVAALLNGASPDVDYGMTAQHVIDAFNAAYASGSYDPLHNELEDRNERGCTAKD